LEIQQLPQYHMVLMVSLLPLVLLHWLLVVVVVVDFMVLVEEAVAYKSKRLLLRLEQLIALPLVPVELLARGLILGPVLARLQRLLV
jgi:hypothetical protein